MKLFTLSVVGLLLTLGASIVALADVPVPPLSSPVIDLSNVLSAGDRAALESKLTAFSKERGSQIAVLLLPTTLPEAIEAYAIRVAEQWKIGRKGIDDGVILVVATDDRALRIEVGYGLEGAIPDAIAKRIIAEVITPHFRAGRLADGLNAGDDAIASVIRGETLPPPPAGSHEPSGGEGDFLAFIFFGALILQGLLVSLVGRSAAAVVVGIAAAGVATFFVPVLLAFFLGLLVFFLSLVSGRGSGGGFRSGGGFSRSSSGGGGGFSGGGGSFGGGGASGRW